tara:strand:+ start:658 stop:912 length:255 start_codon:yes stop_codon:yes gene_type:complete
MNNFKIDLEDIKDLIEDNDYISLETIYKVLRDLSTQEELKVLNKLIAKMLKNDLITEEESKESRKRVNKEIKFLKKVKLYNESK